MADMPGALDTTVSYLEMLAAPGSEPVVAPAADVTVTRLERPSLVDYREMYRRVGERYCWTERLLMEDDRLTAILEDPRVEVWLVRVAGVAAGYAELDRRVDSEIEIAYFGLFPDFYGRHLGRYLLDWAMHRAWSYGIVRLWLHTCSLDHPRALPTYVAAGFRVYATRAEQVQRLRRDTPCA